MKILWRPVLKYKLIEWFLISLCVLRSSLTVLWAILLFMTWESCCGTPSKQWTNRHLELAGAPGLCRGSEGYISMVSSSCHSSLNQWWKNRLKFVVSIGHLIVKEPVNDNCILKLRRKENVLSAFFSFFCVAMLNYWF